MLGVRPCIAPEVMSLPDDQTRTILSICVPTYKRPALLERALRSVVDQPSSHAPRVEIVVSDNSPQLNAHVCQSVLREWPGPTRYLPNPSNIGAIPNFNQSARSASGTYVMFLHDDDRLTARAIDRMVRVLDGPTGGKPVYLFGVDVVDDTRHRLRRQVARSTVRLSPRAGLRRLLLDSSFVRMPGLVLSRDAFIDVGGFNPEVGNPTDFDLLVRLIGVHGMTCIPAVTAEYLVHRDASTTGMFVPSMVPVLMEIFERAIGLGILPEREVRRLQTHWFHQFILGGAYRELRRENRGGAREILTLFDLPDVRALGLSARWAAVRMAVEVLVRTPSAASSRILSLARGLRPEYILRQ